MSLAVQPKVQHEFTMFNLYTYALLPYGSDYYVVVMSYATALGLHSLATTPLTRACTPRKLGVASMFKMAIDIRVNFTFKFKFKF